MSPLGVALSGGGHRAALFALGALQYFADAGKGADLASISSVSGGSMANAYAGQQVDMTTADGTTFEREVTAPFARQIVRRGSLFATPVTKLYVAGLVVLALAALVGPWFLPVPWYWRLAAFVAGLMVAVWYAGLRGRVCTNAFRTALFNEDGAATPLSRLARNVDHVLCATDLRSGDHVYFLGDIVYGFRFGLGGPGDLDLAAAVHASAALPGAFPPLVLPTSRHQFTGAPATPGLEAPPEHLVLVDGGVYDNMADQWGLHHQARVARLPARYADRTPDELVVVNASAGIVWQPLRLSRIPILREVAAILRDKSILYDNTTAHRRVALIERFEMAAKLGEGQRGTYVGIDQSPFRVARRFEAMGDEWPERAERAAAVLTALGDTEAAWAATARADARVGTQLSRMDPADVARLIHHAYVSAMCNTHVILGHPLLAVPPLERFTGLLAG